MFKIFFGYRFLVPKRGGDVMPKKIKIYRVSMPINIFVNSIFKNTLRDPQLTLTRPTFCCQHVNLHPKLIHHLHLILTHLKVYSKCFYLWITSLFLPPLLV